jgi:hypothetical protein
MYRIHYSMPNPTSPDRSLPAILGDFEDVHEARKLADWAATEYGSDVEIHEYAGMLQPPKLVETITAP